MAIRRAFIVFLLPWLVGACATIQLGTEFQTGRSALLAGKPESALHHFRRIAELNPEYVHDSTPWGSNIWTYVGRSYYETGQLPEADAALKQALGRNDKDFIARLYLGLTLLRLPDSPVGDNSLSLQQITYALKERVTPRRLASMVKERGVQFSLTEETERDLRRAGADNDLVEQIRIKSAGVGRSEQGVKEIQQSLREMESWLNYITGAPQGLFWDPGRKIRSQIKASLALATGKKVNHQELINGAEWVGKALEEESDLSRRDEREEKRREQKR